MGLQVILDRQKFTFTDKPALICNNLQTQTIYSFHR
jgi:hypothetical protein